jgi:hypothetical protein
VSGRRAEVVVEGEPEDALLRSARALRRMGARVTRFDVDRLALEARLVRWRLALLVRVHGVAAGGGATGLSVECAREGGGTFDFGLARATIARFRATLATTDPPPLARR